MPLSNAFAVRSGYGSAPSGDQSGNWAQPMVSASGSVSADASTQATGVLVILLIVVVVVAERVLR